MMKNLNSKTVYVRLTWKNKTISISCPLKKDADYIKRFIMYAFKEEIKGSFVSLVYIGKQLTKDNFIDSNNNYSIDNVFKNDFCPKIYANIRSNTSLDQSEKRPCNNFYNYIKENEHKTRASLIDNEEFKNAEALALTFYNKYLNSKNIQFSNMTYCFPLFEKNIKQQFNNYFKNNHQESIDSHFIEHFPLRNYFNLGLMFKLFFMFLLFGFGIKGINFVIFIGFLISYYWYVYLIFNI